MFRKLSISVKQTVVMGLILILGFSKAWAQNPPWVSSIGNVKARPGETVDIPITFNDSSATIAGLDITLTVTSPSDSPDLTPTFRLGKQVSGWITLADSQNPWHIAAASATGVKGIAEILDLRIAVPSNIRPGTIYQLEAWNAIMANAAGVEWNITSLVKKGQLIVPVFGDVNGNGAIDLADIQQLLNIYLGIRTASPDELWIGDVRPKPGAPMLPFGDGLIRANDLNWVLRCFLGLEIGP
jgi:hypothetical protein